MSTLYLLLYDHYEPEMKVHNRAKLSPEDVAEIIRITSESGWQNPNIRKSSEGFISQKSLALRFGVSPKQISRIARREQWKGIGR